MPGRGRVPEAEPGRSSPDSALASALSVEALRERRGPEASGGRAPPPPGGRFPLAARPPPPLLSPPRRVS